LPLAQMEHWLSVAAEMGPSGCGKLQSNAALTHPDS
jgi:hypothetical protein